MSATRRTKGKGGGEPFRPEVGLTDAGSIRVRFVAVPPLRSLYGHERRLSAVIYDLAAHLERRLEELDLRFAVSPEPSDARLTLELGEGDDPEIAAELVEDALSKLGLG